MSSTVRHRGSAGSARQRRPDQGLTTRWWARPRPASGVEVIAVIGDLNALETVTISLGANLIHDLRWSAIQMKQIEGRTHRDGRYSPVYWMVGEETIEEEIAAIVAGRLRAMSQMQGDDATIKDIETLLTKLAA